MKRMIWMALCCFFLIASQTACVPSRLDMDYGMSFKLQKLNQIADLEAGKNVEPAEGVNGKAAEATMGKYQKGFEKEPPATVYNLTIGGIK
jgi:hypothetical protein